MLFGRKSELFVEFTPFKLRQKHCSEDAWAENHSCKVYGDALTPSVLMPACFCDLTTD